MNGNYNKFPANLLKFSACLKIADTADEAAKLIKERKLAYGEPAVAVYREALNTYKCVFGIGGYDPEDPYFINLYMTYDSEGRPIGYEDITSLAENIQEIIRIFDGRKVTDDPLEILNATVNIPSAKAVNEYTQKVIGELEEKIGETVSELKEKDRVQDSSIAAISASLAKVGEKVGGMDASIKGLTVRLTDLGETVGDPKDVETEDPKTVVGRINILAKEIAEHGAGNITGGDGIRIDRIKNMETGEVELKVGVKLKTDKGITLNGLGFDENGALSVKVDKESGIVFNEKGEITIEHYIWTGFDGV